MRSVARALSLLLLCLLLVFLWSESVTLGAPEWEHDCSGDRCAVCFLLMTGESPFGTILLLSAIFALFFCPGAAMRSLCRMLGTPAEHFTPVALRVKLLN